MQTSSSNGHTSFQQLLLQCLAVLVLGLFLFLFFGSLLIGVYQVWYNGRIFPGIAVMGVDLGGLTRMQAAQRLMESAALTPDNSITLWYAGNPLEVSPTQLGISLDLASSVNDAYDFGRRGSIGAWFTYQLGASFTTRNLPPTIIFDQNAAQDTLSRIAEQFDQPVKEAGLSLDGTRVVSELGQTGREMDLSASLDQLGLQVSQLDLY